MDKYFIVFTTVNPAKCLATKYPDFKPQLTNLLHGICRPCDENITPSFLQSSHIRYAAPLTGSIQPAGTGTWTLTTCNDFAECISQTLQTAAGTQSELVAEIHKLADQLPHPGACLVNVIWVFDSIANPWSLCELWSALKRLICWNCAVVHFLPLSDLPQTRKDEWRLSLADSPYDVSFPDKITVAPVTVWKGWLCIRDDWKDEQITLQGFSLSVPASTSAVSGTKTYCFSPCLDVVHECDVSTIPAVYYTGQKLTLHCTSKQDEKAIQWLFKQWSHSQSLGVILRLSFAKKKKAGNSLLTFRNWQEALETDGWSTYSKSFVNKMYNEFIYFLIKPASFQWENYTCSIYVLNSVADLQRHVAALSRRHLTLDESNAEDSVYGALSYFDEKEFSTGVHLADALSQNFKCDFLHQLENEMRHRQSRNTFTEKVLEIEPDALWAERYALESQEPKQAKQSTEGAFVLLPEDIIEKCLNGLSEISKEEIPEKCMVVPVDSVLSGNKLAQMDWPQVLDCRYHDVYYNVPDTKYSVLGAVETSCTCSVFAEKIVLAKASEPKPKKSQASFVQNADLRRSPRLKTKCNSQTSVTAALKVSHQKKLQYAVYVALKEEGISTKHSQYKSSTKKLLAVCHALLLADSSLLGGSGGASEKMLKLARAHVKQIVQMDTG